MINIKNKFESILETYEAIKGHLEDIEQELYSLNADNNAELIELLSEEIKQLKRFKSV